MIWDLAAQRPRFTNEEALDMARELYGVTADSARELPSDRDQNFLLEEASGAASVLKIAGSAEEEAVLDFQNHALLHLARREKLAGCLPRLVPAQNGALIAAVEGNEGQTHLVRLLTFLPGAPLAEIKPQCTALLGESGALLAELDRALRDFEHPAMDRRLHWDLAHAPETLDRYAPFIADPQQRALVDFFLAQYVNEVTPALPGLRRSVIHSDGNDHNILVTQGESGVQRVAGLIDFGDMVYSHTIFELAIAAAYLMLDKDDPAAAAAAVVGGYHAVLPLTEAEIALLPSLIAIRLCISVALSAYQRAQEPHNSYLSVSEGPAWALLARLAALPPGLLHNRLRAACGLAAYQEHAMSLSSKDDILARREAHLGPSLSLSYKKPLLILRGRGQYLYDENGRAYLDVVNNVCHVGHSHPRVVAALARQAALLNTNTRYLHPAIVQFAERLLATLPEPLEVCFFVCSGSEANELALRLARTYTGAEDFIVLDGAYHGNTAALIDISPYKHDGPGGRGAPPHVHTAVMPDPYRGPYKDLRGLPSDEQKPRRSGTHYAEQAQEDLRGLASDAQEPRGPGSRYADHVRELAQNVLAGGRGLAGMIAEPVLGCGGQIVLPDGYLQEAFAHVRAAGGVCIVDEVQVGFGRVGSHFWGFETQGIVPDIVTMGKPMGNGHPLAAVVTTRAIADAFANGMEYFNTFGGNPVSCAVGSAVLDVIEEEGLRENARRVGEHLLHGLRGLMARHALIGDVRGLGLFIGVELVRDHETLEPAAAEAAYIVERMKDEGILLSIDGPLHNVLKLKPPLVFTMENADFLVSTLDKVLGF